MARHKISIAVLIVISILLIASSCCSADPAEFLTAPWMVEIFRNSLLTGEGGATFHCTGVLGGLYFIRASIKCIESLPAHSQVIMYAGTVASMARHSKIQIFHPAGPAFFDGYAQAAEFLFTPEIVESKFLNYMPIDAESNEIKSFGFQFGWIRTLNATSRLEVLQFDFSNSTDLCDRINENNVLKFCTQVDASQCNMNFGGEALMKVLIGQTILTAFWQYDDCDQNIRVFQKLSHG